MRVLGAGDNVVDRYPDLGVLFPGGNAINVPVAARRAGAEAAYLGVLGDDQAGRVVLVALDLEGVETARARVEQGPNAWADVRLLDGDRVFGESSLGVSPFRMGADDIAYAATFDVVHLCAGGFLEEDLLAIAAVARVSFDFKLQRDPAYLDPLLAGTTFAFFSASDLDDDTTATLLEHATRAGARVAIATRGARDAIAFDGRRAFRQAPTTAALVDTLGAGDSFIGRFLVGHLGGEAIATSLRAAADAAAVTCTTFGAFGHGHAYQPEDSSRSTFVERGVKGAVPQL